MIPLRDVIPSRTTPVVTLALIGVHAAFFVYELTLSGAELLALFRGLGVVPAALSWVTLLTSVLPHAGWTHAAGNLIALWLFGENVEDRLGHARYLLFYVGAGALAGLAYTWLFPASPLPMVGASGAVAAILGAYLVLFPRSRVLVAVPLLVRWDIVEVPAVTMLGLWLALQVVAGAILMSPPGVPGLSAPLAGFLAGAAAIRLVARPERARPEWYDPVRRPR